MQFTERDSISVPMERGQVPRFSSLTLHRIGPNTPPEPRLGYGPQYDVPGVISTYDQELFGDQFPVQRAGKPVQPRVSGCVASGKLEIDDQPDGDGVSKTNLINLNWLS